MPSGMTRRELLRRSAQSAAAIAAGGMFGAAADAERKPPYLPVTTRDAMLQHTGIANCWDAMREVGAEGVEATIGEDLSLPGLFHPNETYSAATPAGIERILADAEAAGQKITALCMFNRFEERPDFEVAWCRRVARVAGSLGVPVVRIDVVPQRMDRKQFLAHSIAVLKRTLAATEPTGVKFGIENHGNTSNDPAFLAPLFDGVGSDRLGLTLDTGNFYWYGHPLSHVYEIYERFAGRAFHTHCKSIAYPADQREKQRPMGWRYGDFHGPIHEGDVDFARVVAILRKADYAGDLCVEDESLGKLPPAEAARVLKQEIELLRKLR